MRTKIVSVRFSASEVVELRRVSGGNLSDYLRRVVLACCDDVVQRGKRCEWSGCRLAATGSVRSYGEDHPLCDEHVRPEMHPPDLHRHIHPGRIPTKPCMHADA